MDSGTNNLLKMLSARVTELSNAGKWDEALRSAITAVEKARAANEGELSDIIGLGSALEVQGDIYRQCNLFEDSRVAYLEAMELLNGHHECTESLARISASTGVLYDLSQNDQEAIIFYERALQLYDRVDPPPYEEMADICNNLGFIYRTVGNGRSAEKLFLRGLEISNDTRGKNDPKTSILFNNLGALYLKSGDEEQAREMHTMALEGRLEALGKNHPDTAQSYSNLALALAQIGDTATAKENFQKAMHIYDENIKSESHEYAAVVENYAEFLCSEGEADLAQAIVKKAKKKLAKVAPSS